MFFRSKRHFLSDQKVRYKMPKLPKRLLVVGITFLSLCLGIGVSAKQVQATPQPVQTVNSRAASSHQNSKEAIAPTNVLNSKASVKAKSPNSRFGSPFVPRVGLKDHLHNRCCTGNDCSCEENGDECTCEDSDDNCGCIDINKSDCECGWNDICDCDDHCNEGDNNGDSNDDYGTFKIKLKKKDIYWGRDYTVEGSITYNKTGNFNGPLHYYYRIDGQGGMVEFQGPQSVGSNPETFKFTIPHEKLTFGKKHEIYIIAEDEIEDETEVDSNAAYLRLITPAKIKAVDKTYYVGDPFDQFGNFAGGLSVTNQPLTKEELTDTVIRDTNGKKVRNWNEITAKPGEYTITYIYKYGSDDECGCPDLFSDGSICKKANISVIDHKKITLKYVDQSLKPIENKYLTNLAEGMAPGDHSEGNYGSKFPLVKTPELSFNGKKYYEFVRFEYAVRPAPDLTEDYVTFGDHDQVINVVYEGVKSNITVEFINSNNERLVGRYMPSAKRVGDVLKVVPDSNGESDISKHIPRGYQYDKAKNGQLGLKDPIYDVGTQTVRVYVKPDVATQDVEVELININNFKDNLKGTKSYLEGSEESPSTRLRVNLAGHQVYTIKPTESNLVDDKINLQEYILLSTGTPENSIVAYCKLSEGYRYATTEELSRLNLKAEEARFGGGVVKVKLYVVKDTSYKLKIDHRVVGRNSAKVPGLPIVSKEVNSGETFEINTKDPVHRAPRGYRIVGAGTRLGVVDRGYQYSRATGLITGKAPEIDVGQREKTFYILYEKF